MAFLAGLKAKAVAWTAANPWKAICTVFVSGALLGRIIL